MYHLKLYPAYFPAYRLSCLNGSSEDKSSMLLILEDHHRVCFDPASRCYIPGRGYGAQQKITLFRLIFQDRPLVSPLGSRQHSSAEYSRKGKSSSGNMEPADKSESLESGLPKEIQRTSSISSDTKGNTVIEQENGETYTLDAASEKRLVRKFDLRILPLLAVMYLFNALDKANLGNAKTAGLEKSLGMEGTNQYNIILSIFFVPYVLTAPVLAIVGKKYGPSRVLPAMMLTFGSMTLLVVAAYNFAGIFVLRWFLGMAESKLAPSILKCIEKGLTENIVIGAFFPLVIYYQTQFYRRGELGRRLAIFYAASNIAYAFGGLLAFGTFQIESGGIDSWRWLFVIEGSLTVCLAVVAFIFLPYSAARAKFLNEEEKKLAFYRMQVDSSAVVNEKFVFREAVSILKEPTSWVILAIEICLGIPLQSVALFLPQIVARLGYETVKTNLYTVAPNITGAVMLLILGFASDYTRWRFPFVALGFFLHSSDSLYTPPSMWSTLSK